VLDAAGDLFSPRYVENLPGNVLLKSYGQLLPGEIRAELMLSWDAEAKKSPEDGNRQPFMAVSPAFA
jgi:hypothetical protein